MDDPKTLTHHDKLICIGRIRAPHGVRGLLRVESYTEDPMSLFAYSSVCLEDGSPITLTFKGNGQKDCFLAALGDVTTRDEADAYKAEYLYVHRSHLPALNTGDEFGLADSEDTEELYIADLIGLEVRLETEDASRNIPRNISGNVYGVVCDAPDYGAGILLEVLCNQECETSDNKVLIPFTIHHVPHIDLEAGYLTVRINEMSKTPPVEDQILNAEARKTQTSET